MRAAPQPVPPAPVTYLGAVTSPAQLVNFLIEAHLQAIAAAEHAIELADQFRPRLTPVEPMSVPRDQPA